VAEEPASGVSKALETVLESVSLEDEQDMQRYLTRLASVPDDHETRIALARIYLRNDMPDASAKEYEQLVQVPSLHDTLIADLERAVEEYPRHPALYRVLGDVYMRAGQLADALTAYKKALKVL